MRNSPALSPGLYFPLYRRGPNRYCVSQFLPRHCAARHILCSCTFPLRPFNGGCLCHCSRLCALIPAIFRLHPSLNLNKNPLRSHVPRGQPNILPSTLPRSCWDASTILRLPRRLHSLKYSLIYWLHGLPRGSNHVPIYYLRSFRRQT